MKKINKRYLFLEASNSEYELLRKNIPNFLLNNERNNGFVLSHLSSNAIEGSHVNKEKRIEELVLPNGEKLSFERPIVDIVEFKISFNRTGLLELTNPPRKTSVFLRDLELASNFSIALKTMNIDLHKIHSEFIRIFSEAKAYFVYIRSTSISEQTHAAIKIESEISAYIEGNKYFNLSNKKIDKIGFRIGQERIEISKNGSVYGSASFISENETRLKSMIIDHG